MKWVTRARPKTDRIACPWLIRRFIDPDAEILYVPKQDVLGVAHDQQAHSFDAPGAEFDHRDGRCTFEVLIDHFGSTATRPSCAWPRSCTPPTSTPNCTPTPSAPACWPSVSVASTSKPTTTGCWNGPRSSTTPSTPGPPNRP